MGWGIQDGKFCERDGTWVEPWKMERLFQSWEVIEIEKGVENEGWMVEHGK